MQEWLFVNDKESTYGEEIEDVQSEVSEADAQHTEQNNELNWTSNPTFTPVVIGPSPTV